MTPEQRFKCMSHNRAKNTGPELSLRHSLWRQGFRYRVNDKRLPGRPDIVLAQYRTAIFVHGCFWHGHKDCKHYTVPKANTEFWMAKVARNQESADAIQIIYDTRTLDLAKLYLPTCFDTSMYSLLRSGKGVVSSFEKKRSKIEDALQKVIEALTTKAS